MRQNASLFSGGRCCENFFMPICIVEQDGEKTKMARTLFI